MFDVVVLGSANLDLVVHSPRHPKPGETLLGSDYAEFPGGKGLNQAVAARRSGAATAFVGAVGDDDAGRQLRDVAASAKVDVEFLLTVAGVPTGRALITVADDGDNTIVVVPGANAHVAPTAPTSPVLTAQLEIPVSVVVAAFGAARAARTRTLLNPAPAQDLPAELLAVTDIIVPNEHEVDLLGGAESLLERGVTAVVTTLGAGGATVLECHDGRTRESNHPAPEVEPIDTTGAGDAFCGGLAARLAAGDSLEAAVQWALAAGSLATTVRGAVPSLPTAAAIRKMLSVRA